MVLTSPFRQFFTPFVEFISELCANHPDRDITVVIPDLIMSHWWEGIFHNNRGAVLRAMIRARCSDHVVVISTLFHLHD